MESNAMVLAHLAGQMSIADQPLVSASDSPMDCILYLSNSFTLINLIPTELLIEIFSYLRRDAGFNGDLVNATHVCKHWREVALRAPYLWTQIKLHDVSAAEAFLQRSQDLPVSLYLWVPPEDILPDVADALEPHLHRIRSFHGEFRALNDLLTFPNIFVQPAAVQELSLYLGDEALQDDAIFSHHAHEFFPPVQPELFPLIRDLKIYNSPSLASLNEYANLTTLTLQGMLPGVNNIIEALAACGASLTELTIDATSHVEDSEDPLFPPEPVHLPRLETFFLRLDTAEVNFALLGSLTFPETCAVVVDVIVFEENPFHDIPAVDCMRGLWHFSVGWDDAHGRVLRVCGWKDPQAAVPSLDMSVLGGEKFGNPLLEDWPVDVSCVRVLEVDLRGLGSVTSFSAGLRRFTDLETIRLVRPGEEAIAVLVQDLQDSAPVPGSGTSTAGEGGASDDVQRIWTCCPRLLHIELEDFTWYRHCLEVIAPLVNGRGKSIGPQFSLTALNVKTGDRPPDNFRIDCDRHVQFFEV